jgi:predicted SnoaL-like aldol condensation-catalyzing enzyme
MSQSNLSPSSNSENNKEFVHNFVEDAFNKHDMEAIDKYYTVNLIQHNPQVPQGREGF